MSHQKINQIINILKNNNLPTNYTGVMAYIQSSYHLNQQELKDVQNYVRSITKQGA